MLKHCSPSSVDIRRRSRRNLLTIVDSADVESDIVITDHVYDIEHSETDRNEVWKDVKKKECESLPVEISFEEGKKITGEMCKNITL